MRQIQRKFLPLCDIIQTIPKSRASSLLDGKQFSSSATEKFIQYLKKTSKPEFKTINSEAFTADLSLESFNQAAKLAKVSQHQPQDFFNPYPAKIITSAKEPLIINYGKQGLSPNNSCPKPDNLLTDKLELPLGSHIVSIPALTPFNFETSCKQTLLMPVEGAYITNIPHVKHALNAMETQKLYEFEPRIAEMISAQLALEIFSNPHKQKFYEEDTSIKMVPSNENHSSGTLMRFKGKQAAEDTTPTHFHPGERCLFIFTTEQPASATLSSCGIYENPNDASSPKRTLDFSPNSLHILRFPPYTHHKFHGEFLAFSVHPYETPDVIAKMYQAKDNEGGFLGMSTILSECSNDKYNKAGEWKIGGLEEETQISR